jgi:ribosomal-protein-alanine N-acetyltransferase
VTCEAAKVFRTKRTRVRAADASDVGLIHTLWTDPRVTTFVGFPKGIPTTPNEIRKQIERDRDRPLKRLLIAERSSDGQPIGEVKLGEPGADGISEPDIKLLPDHWSQGYGRELWRAMIDHLFEHTDCLTVQGTPNVRNIASIRMMESCGMRRVGEGVFEPLERMADVMVPVLHFVYRIARRDWEEKGAS